MLIAMLAMAESLRVQQYVRFMSDSDLNSGASTNGAGGASADNSARNVELKATLADPSAQELARFDTQLNDMLLAQMAGDPKLQEGIQAFTGEVSAMMADPLVQVQATLLAEEVEKAMVDPKFQEQAKQLLEQAKGVMTQMQTMMTDPLLQGEAERAAEQMVKGMMAEGNEEAMEAMEAMEAIKANPIFEEYTKRLFEQFEGMEANQNFPGLAARIAQLSKTLMVDPSFQSHARRIATHLEAISAHLTSQSTDGGSSLAEVGRSSSESAFLPRSLFRRKPVDIASSRAAEQHPRSDVRMSVPLATPGGRQSHSGTASDTSVQPPSAKQFRSKGAVMSADDALDEFSKGAAALIALAVAFHAEAAKAGVVAVDGGTVGLEVSGPAFLAVILGLGIPVVFLVTLFIQSDAQGTATTFRQPDSIGGTRFEDE